MKHVILKYKNPEFHSQKKLENEAYLKKQKYFLNKLQSTTLIDRNTIETKVKDVAALNEFINDYAVKFLQVPESIHPKLNQSLEGLVIPEKTSKEVEFEINNSFNTYFINKYIRGNTSDRGKNIHIIKDESADNVTTIEKYHLTKLCTYKLQFKLHHLGEKTKIELKITGYDANLFDAFIDPMLKDAAAMAKSIR
jgi:hypothetical protein